VVFQSQDPLAVEPLKGVGAFRILPDDLVVASPYDRRWFAMPRRLEYQIKSPMIQFRKKDSGAAVWKTPSLAELKKIAGS
jgi:hypothetical protein